MVNMLTSTASHMVRVGPAGWSYKDWEGVVYPTHGSRFDPLEYLAHYFDTIEVNSSFYRIPPPSNGRSWARRVGGNDAFRFTVKLYRGFTHEAEGPAAGDAAAFREMLDPLAGEGRLGGVLIQFPWSFKDGPEARTRLSRIVDEFASYPLAVEVRHGSFQSPDFLDFLTGRGVAFVNIDQPIFGNSIRPSAIVTGPIAYVRLHGRNAEKWFAHEESWERYDYLYSPEELEPWVGRARELAEKRDVYVVTNNHFRGQAIVNALDLKRGLGQQVEVPPALREAWGERVGSDQPR
jgi:uncharacterized protein YecE (DUF72 family)